MSIERSELEDRLRDHVDRLAGLIGPRPNSNPHATLAAIGYITSVWEDIGYAVRREEFDAQGDLAVNLVSETPGDGDPDSIVVLGAHYDTVAYTAGADDNASAVAVLLEASRLLFAHNGRRTIRYVAFACEEPPHFATYSMGSRVHASGARQRNERILGALVLEMVGYFSEKRGSQGIPDSIPRLFRRFIPDQGNFLAAVGNLSSWKLLRGFRRGFRKASTLPLFAIALPEKVEEIRMSDNRSFWDEGYPSLMITDTSFLRNPHYHQLSDLPDTLNYEAMIEVVLGVTSACKQLLR